MRIMIYDVETAQMNNIGSICSVGWILLDNDQEISSGYSLINPHCGFDGEIFLYMESQKKPSPMHHASPITGLILSVI